MECKSVIKVGGKETYGSRLASSFAGELFTRGFSTGRLASGLLENISEFSTKSGMDGNTFVRAIIRDKNWWEKLRFVDGWNDFWWFFVVGDVCGNRWWWRCLVCGWGINLGCGWWLDYIGRETRQSTIKKSVNKTAGGSQKCGVIKQPSESPTRRQKNWMEWLRDLSCCEPVTRAVRQFKTLTCQVHRPNRFVFLGGRIFSTSNFRLHSKSHFSRQKFRGPCIGPISKKPRCARQIGRWMPVRIGIRLLIGHLGHLGKFNSLHTNTWNVSRNGITGISLGYK